MTIGELGQAITHAQEMADVDMNTPIVISVAAEGSDGSFVRSPESVGVFQRENGEDTLCLCVKSFNVEDAKHLLNEAEAAVGNVKTEEEEGGE